MNEKEYFTVNADGEAEHITEVKNKHGTTLHLGEAALQIGGATSNNEATHYVDQGGRVINTQTGDVITHGNGRNRAGIVYNDGKYTVK